MQEKETDIFVGIYERLRLAELGRYSVSELVTELESRGCRIVGIDETGALIGGSGCSERTERNPVECSRSISE